ncbi:MAG: hypothetical protein II998_01330 [Clostridia bacterium]|nr:hypothetical protein [Clostridia bacterium]
MKRFFYVIISFVFAMSVLFVFSSCSDDSAKESATSDEQAIKNYVEENGEAMEKEMEEKSVSESGSDVDYVITANGTTINVECLRIGVNDVSESIKNQMQELYDTPEMKDSVKETFADTKAELPSLKSILYSVCEEDGDAIVTIQVDF